MKKSLVILYFLSICSLSQAQFSGEIVYEFKYETTNNQAIKDVLEGPKIDSVRYSISQYAYKSVSFSQGEIVEEYVYDPASKKMLFSMGNRPYYLYLQTDLEKFKSDVKLQIEKSNTEKILDYSAYKTTHPTTGEINYYSDEIAIETGRFSTHYFMQWNEILKQTKGGIPLKTITKQNGYTEIKTAIRLEEKADNKLDFSFDENKTQIAAYDNLDEVADFPDLDLHSLACYQYVIKQKADLLIEGKDYLIIMRLVVHPDGSLTHIEVEKSDYEYLNEAAKQIIETCDLGFEPGSIDGLPVSSEIYYPINF